MTQITVSAGSAVNVTLPADNRLVIGGSGIYRVGPLGTSQRPTVDQLIDTTTTVGPFEDSCVVSIRATGGSAVYEVIAPTDALDSRGLPALVSGATFVPQGFTFAAVAEAVAAAAAAGGVVALLGADLGVYEFGNNTIQIPSGVSILGQPAVTVNPTGGAPDIGAALGRGTVINCTAPYAFVCNNVEGAQFTGSINTAGVLTVTTVNTNPLTGNTGTVKVGALVRSTGNWGGDSPSIAPGQTSGSPIVLSQLTGTPGGAGTYQTNRTGLNFSGVPMYMWDAPLCVTGVRISDIAVKGGASALQAGAYNAPGLSFAWIENIFCFGATQGRGVDLLNFEHLNVTGLFNFQCIHGQRLGMYSDNPDGGFGNSTITHVYNQTNNAPYSLGIELGAGYNHPGYGGYAHRYEFIQNNHYGRSQYIDTGVSTNSTADITVTDGTKFPKGMPVRWISSNPAGFIGGANVTGANNTGNQVTYFVVSQVGNVIQIALAPDGAAIAASASLSGLSLSHWGFPHVTIRGGSGSPVYAYVNTVDFEGPGAMLLLHRLVARVGHLVAGNSSNESVVRRNCTVHIDGDSALYFDDAGTNTECSHFGGKRMLLNTTGVSGGNTTRGVFFDGQSAGAASLQLGGNVGPDKAAKTLVNRSPANADWTYPGLALGVRQGYSATATRSINLGSDVAGFGVYTGSGAGTWTWGQGLGSSMQGYRQTFVNKGTGALTVTLSASDGTFGGMTGGSSAGKSMSLAAPTSTTPGGSLTIVCTQTGASTYEWQIESMQGATLV